MQKNVASQKAIFFAFDATTNLPKTGDAANITGYVSKDFGTVTVLGDTSATEMDATNAKGFYLFDLTQAETNADALLFSAKSSTSNIVVVGAPAYVQTIPAAFTLAGGAAGGVMIAGSNAATTLASLTVTGATTLTGNVALADGLTIAAPSTGNRAGLSITGNGTGQGVIVTGGATGAALKLVGGGTSGEGVIITTTSGDGISVTATGSSKHGVVVTGGNGGTSDGIKFVAGTGGVGVRLDTLTASGTVSLAAVSTSGTVTLNALTVSNATTLSGAVSLGSTLGVTGTVTLAAVNTGAIGITTLTASGTVSLAAVTTSGTVTLNALTVSNATTLSGAVSLGSTLGVAGTTTLAAVTTTGTVTLNALTVSNATTLSGAVSLGSTLGITGTVTLAAVNTGAIGTGNVTIGGTLATSGTVTLNALTVTNATTLSGAITGTNASNDLRINGAVPGGAGGLLIDDVWTDARAAKLDNLDAAVSTRLATASYTTPPTAVQNRQEMDANSAGLAAIYARQGAPAGASQSADVAALKAVADAVLDDTGTSGVVVAAASKTGYELSATGVTAIWDKVITGSTTAIQAMRGFIAAMLGKASGLATTSAKYRNIADTKDVISATVDADGNRSAVTLDLT